MTSTRDGSRAAAAIEIDGLTVARGHRTVLPGIGLEVVTGAVTGLLGPSGSGKTTLMRAIVGVQIVAGGRIRLLGEPEVLILDEPTVGLDPVLRQELWGTFHSLADAGATILVSTHVMDEADRCDQLMLMREGEIVATGTPDQLRERAQTGDLEQAFLKLATA